MISNKQPLNYPKSSYMLNDTPLVSIIIGNYNYEHFVGQAIDSVLNQTYSNIEVIVVDDGSQDNSREVINKYGNRVIPIFKENGGQPSNYNAGFAASKGEIICFLDSDDLFVADKIEKVVNVFNSSEEIGWCFHSLKLVDVNNKPLSMSTTENYETRECDFRNRLKSGKIPPSLPPCSGLCFRRSLLEKILPMPAPKIIKNNDYYIKFMSVGLSKGFILSDELALQKIHDSNAVTLRKDREHLKARDFIYTGIWVKQEFPNFGNFADKMVALGINFNWIAGNNDFENSKAIKEFFSLSSLWEIIQINSMSLYYYLKKS